MASDTARDKLAEQLKEHLPHEWVIVPYSKTLERIDKTVVMLHATEIRQSAAAQGVVEVDYTISVTSPLTDSDRATAALDDDVLTLILTLQAKAPGLLFRNATPTTVSDYFAWDINTTTHASWKD